MTKSLNETEQQLGDEFPVIEVKISSPSLNREAGRVESAIRNKHKEAILPGGAANLPNPQEITHDEARALIENEYSSRYYEQALEALTGQRAVLEESLAVLANYQEAWGFSMPQTVEVRLTRYGRSLYSKIDEGMGTVTLRLDSEAPSPENLVRETVLGFTHMCLQETLDPYDISHTDREAIETSVALTLFPQLFPEMVKHLGVTQYEKYKEKLPQLKQLLAEKFTVKNLPEVEHLDSTVLQNIRDLYFFTSDEELQSFNQVAAQISEEPIDEIAKAKKYAAALHDPHASVNEVKRSKSGESSKPTESLLPKEQLLEGIVYIDIPSWNRDLPGLTETLDQIIKSSKDTAQGYIFDMRKNPGGHSIRATACAYHFLPEGDYRYGTLVGKNSVGEEETIPTDFHSSNEDPIDKPIVILTSNTTCSAAEVFILLLKERDNVTLLGAETSGAGPTASTSKKFKFQGKEYEVRIPTQRFYANNSEVPLNYAPVQPDIKSDPKNNEEILAKALEILH